MKKYEKNPLAWFFIVTLFGWWAIESGSFEGFIIFILALILSKQIEIINKIKK